MKLRFVFLFFFTYFTVSDVFPRYVQKYFFFFCFINFFTLRTEKFHQTPSKIIITTFHSFLIKNQNSELGGGGTSLHKSDGGGGGHRQTPLQHRKLGRESGFRKLKNQEGMKTPVLGKVQEEGVQGLQAAVHCASATITGGHTHKGPSSGNRLFHLLYLALPSMAQQKRRGIPGLER